MNIDLTVSIAIILSLSTIFAQVLITIINNIHQLKVKKIEINEKYVISTFHDYLAKLEQCIAFNGIDNYQEYSKAYGRALLYASAESNVLMKTIDEIIKKDQSQDLSNVITSEMTYNLSRSLRKDIRRIKI